MRLSRTSKIPSTFTKSSPLPLSSSTTLHTEQSAFSKHLTHTPIDTNPRIQQQPQSLQDILSSLFPRTLPRPLLQLCVLFCVASTFCGTPVTSAYPSLRYGSSSSSSPIFSQLLNEQATFVNEENGPLVLDVGQRTAVSSQNVVLGTLLILFGLIHVFFGFKLLRVTLFLTGFLSWAIVVILIIATARWELAGMLFKPSHYYFWIWFLAGLVGATLSLRFWDIGVTFMGAFGGFALGMGIIAAANQSIPMFARYILLAGVSFLGAAIATFWERPTIIMGTSLAGAFMFMYGVDEFVQLGYREMMVIFGFAGKTLTYRPNKKVFTMIGCSLALACLGIALEFWFHQKPLWGTREALFRIYGRPFGKRPQRLVGQQIRNKVCDYLEPEVCLEKTADDVSYEGDDSLVDDDDYVVVSVRQSRLPVCSELEEVSVEKPSEGSETIVPSDGSISSKTPSSYHDSDADAEQSIESVLALPTLSPIQIVIDEAEFENDGSGKMVPVRTHTESINVAETRISMDSATTRNENHSTPTEHHHTTITTTTTTTTATTPSGSISSSGSASHHHASMTPDTL